MTSTLVAYQVCLQLSVLLFISPCGAEPLFSKEKRVQASRSIVGWKLCIKRYPYIKRPTQFHIYPHFPLYQYYSCSSSFCVVESPNNRLYSTSLYAWVLDCHHVNVRGNEIRDETLTVLANNASPHKPSNYYTLDNGKFLKRLQSR